MRVACVVVVVVVVVVEVAEVEEVEVLVVEVLVVEVVGRPGCRVGVIQGELEFFLTSFQLNPSLNELNALSGE